MRERWENFVLLILFLSWTLVLQLKEEPTSDENQKQGVRKRRVRKDWGDEGQRAGRFASWHWQGSKKGILSAAAPPACDSGESTTSCLPRFYMVQVCSHKPTINILPSARHLHPAWWWDVQINPVETFFFSYFLSSPYFEAISVKIPVSLWTSASPLFGHVFTDIHCTHFSYDLASS